MVGRYLIFDNYHDMWSSFVCAMNINNSQILFRFIATKIVNRIVSSVTLCFVIIVQIRLWILTLPETCSTDRRMELK